MRYYVIRKPRLMEDEGMPHLYGGPYGTKGEANDAIARFCEPPPPRFKILPNPPQRPFWHPSDFQVVKEYDV